MVNVIAHQRNILGTQKNDRGSYLDLELFILFKKFEFHLVTKSFKDAFSGFFYTC
jgi:hypothetical protein